MAIFLAWLLASHSVTAFQLGPGSQWNSRALCRIRGSTPGEDRGTVPLENVVDEYTRRSSQPVKQVEDPKKASILEEESKDLSTATATTQEDKKEASHLMENLSKVEDTFEASDPNESPVTVNEASASSEEKEDDLPDSTTIVNQEESPVLSTEELPAIEEKEDDVPDSTTIVNEEESPVLSTEELPAIEEKEDDLPDSTTIVNQEESPVLSTEELPAIEEKEDDVSDSTTIVNEEESPVLSTEELPAIEEKEDVSDSTTIVNEEGPVEEAGDSFVEIVDTEKEEDSEIVAARVLADFSAGGGRNLEVARLQTLLERSQSRRRQVEAVVAEELAALRAQLESELQNEKKRAQSVGSLLNELERTLSVKQTAVDREKALLVQLQDVAQRTKETEIKKSIEEAIETKASLVAIELLLIEDIEECAVQVLEEGKEMDKRVKAMTMTRDALPAVDDALALRSFSWSQIEDLENQLKESALAIAKTDAKVRVLRARISDALDQRDAVLSTAPTSDVAIFSKGKGSSAVSSSSNRQNILNLRDLDDEALANAVRTSASAAAGSVTKLGSVFIASLSTFFDSDNSLMVKNLLSQASNSTKLLSQSLSSAAKVETKALPQYSGNNQSSSLAASDDDDDQRLAADTANQLGEISKNLGSAVAVTASGLAQASKETGLAQTAAEAMSAVSATAFSASVLAFRKIQQTVSGSLPTTPSTSTTTKQTKNSVSPPPASDD